MSDFDENIEYIDAYFKNQLSDIEKRQFEERCVQDQPFAMQVASYITEEEGIRQELLRQKKQYWAAKDGESGKTIVLRQVTLRKWLPYAAAACLILAVGLYFLIYSDTPRRLANSYVTEHFTVLSQTMNASKDSIEVGIAAYNNRDYNRALQIFQKIYRQDPTNIKAKRFMGLVYLVTKEYDKALQQFDELAAMKEVYRNDGLFLKAITLLERNMPGDKSASKTILEQIVNEKSEGSTEAEKWLKSW